MKKTTVVNLKTHEFDVYIGRGSKWGNRFVIGIDGDRKQVIQKYKEWVLQNIYLVSCLHELKGKILGCYCKPEECHGDILAKLVEQTF